MSDVESEELEDQGPNLGVCIGVILSICCSRVHRAMKAIATNKKKDTDTVKPCYQMATLTKDIILMVNVMGR